MACAMWPFVDIVPWLHESLNVIILTIQNTVKLPYEIISHMHIDHCLRNTISTHYRIPWYSQSTDQAMPSSTVLGS